MKKSFLLFVIIIGFTTGLNAQELNCQVRMITQQISGTDKRIFDLMQTQISEFMNNRKWTTETFGNIERIDCNLTINITERLSTDEFNATIQVQYTRLVFESSYKSTLLNFVDNDIHFRYAEGQQLNYSETTYLSNLTSILAFYANMIIGLDYDSFSLNGGTPYLQKALAIANSAQASDERGWKAFDGTRNRYWMINNILDAPFIPLRECIYNYHRKGLDVMSQNSTAGRTVILQSIESLSKVHDVKPLSFSLQLFFNAKSEEIINIFTNAKPEEKTKLMDVLGRIDPTNNNKYQKIINPN